MTLCSFLRLAWSSVSQGMGQFWQMCKEPRHPVTFLHNYRSNFLKLKSKPISIAQSDVLAKHCIAKLVL